jgi:hypothetical protein
LNDDYLYVYVDLLGERIRRGLMRRRKREKHCRTSWFKEIY